MPLFEILVEAYAAKGLMKIPKKDLERIAR
jgi:hypothetical protein